MRREHVLEPWQQEWGWPGFRGFGLVGQALTEAVQDNRRLARRLGWANVVGGVVRPTPEVLAILQLGPNPGQEELARAIARWQAAQPGGMTADGKLGAGTWTRMREVRVGGQLVIPRPTFQAFSRPVDFGGRRLGILEKTIPYPVCYFDPGPSPPCRPTRSGVTGERGGTRLQLGFRVTDPEAVRRAGFVDGSGEDRFRWIQVIHLITLPLAGATTPTPADIARGFVRRATSVIDPSAPLASRDVDAHPYYFTEQTPTGGNPAFNVANFLNRPARNRLAYDLIFEDQPMIRLTETLPGQPATFNFEVALVGLRGTNPIRNVILTTVTWGFDLVIEGGVPTVKPNPVQQGTFGGSPRFRRVLNESINGAPNQFPGHCFVGAGFTGRARCR